MRFAAFFVFASFVSIACSAQQLKYTAFTVNDGLPSNYVYRCIEDNKGFLWVATDAGIARFDGRHFQVFTTRDGLPDNEVLAVVKENNGRIWVNCFKQSPAYFDETQNRFINAKENRTLAKVKEGTGKMFFFTLEGGGILFYNEKGSFIFKDNKLIADPGGAKNDDFLIDQIKDGTRLKYGTSNNSLKKKTYQAKIYQLRGNKYIDSIPVKTNRTADHLLLGLNDGKFYLFNTSTGKCNIYSNFKTNPLRLQADSVSIPEPFTNFEFTSNCFYLAGASGKTYLFDKKTLKITAVISGNYLPNSIYKDSKENIWVSTIDKGLLVYKKKQFGNIEMPAGYTNTSFLSIARQQNGTLLAGNFYGEVLEARGAAMKINTIPKTGLIARQRKIIISQNKIFTFSEAGIYVNYTRTFKNSPPDYGKTALAYNDSIIIVGQSYNLRKLNSITEKLTTLHGLTKRVTALTRDAAGMIYFGSTDGLYKYNYAKDTTVALYNKSPLLRERITGLCTTTDKLLWVATSGSGLVVVKDDKVLLHISEKNGIINNSSRSITTGKPGQIWLGTDRGISVVSYTLENNKISYSIRNLSKNDGLTDNMINEMVCQHDTVFAATGNGISVIPVNISIPHFNIPVRLIRLTVNQRDTVLLSNYKLSFKQENIQMQFAGIELNGHFRNLQYTLDRNKNWAALDGSTLTVELSSGKHTVQVRAVDVNGNISNKILTVNFDISTPFWKAIWFWIIIVLVLQAITIYLLNRRLKRRREAKLAKEIETVQIASLEQQAFTSLMNPHFMFNALNSIQHYINVQDRQNANRYLSDFASLIRKNFEAAQQSFIPLEQEIENIKIYLRLEQMRFSDRFAYQVIIGENLDIEEWMIPTMILQPLLENALLHGIMPSTIAGELIIELKLNHENLLITIIDNGIGIANSLALKETGTHASRGMELIKKRIGALSRFGTHAITISMSPAFASEKNPGNKIIFFIPHLLHQAWQQAQQRQ
ncbi:histidine kinase [soil metagenome]|jgi:sugar lactone lactonase YvrE/two-component sensor histidine kinase